MVMFALFYDPEGDPDDPPRGSYYPRPYLDPPAGLYFTTRDPDLGGSRGGLSGSPAGCGEVYFLYIIILDLTNTFLR
jgi:hypothetical protein